uniref:Ovule protein n=1 Tax=Meloidogyne incognita TaxID=6306 RepID=A0A914NVA9_MELIC
MVTSAKAVRNKKFFNLENRKQSQNSNRQVSPQNEEKSPEKISPTFHTQNNWTHNLNLRTFSKNNYYLTLKFFKINTQS